MQYHNDKYHAFTDRTCFRLIMLYSSIVLFLSITSCLRDHEAPRLRSAVFFQNNGYGYVIYMDGKIIIRQNHIPGFEKRPFCDSIDALKVSGMVMEKVAGEESINLTIKDLTLLGVEVNCKRK